MFSQVQLSQIMSTDLITVGPQATLDKVDEIFNTYDFHHIPVVDEAQHLLGIISKSDYFVLCDSMTLFQKEQQREQNKRFFRSLLAEDVMKKQVAKLRPDDVLTVAAGLFRENLFHAIPIVDHQQKLVGMVTTFDMINYAYSPPVEKLAN